MSTGETDLDSRELRALVREVLLTAIPDGLAAAGAAGSEPIGTVQAGATEQPPVGMAGPGRANETGAIEVALTTDADLSAFVERIAADCADPQRRAELAAGRVRYTLAGSAAKPGGADPGAAMRIERGAVTERHVREAARSGTAIVAARGVVITPLARDRARTSGVDIEKEH